MRNMFRRNSTKLGQHLSKCIFYVGMGSNDYLNNYFMPGFYSTGSDYNPKTYAALLLQDYCRLINKMYELGARKVAVVGVGQIGCIPYELARLDNDGKSAGKSASRCNEKINKAISVFNAGLLQMVKKFNREMPCAKLVYVNTYQSSQDLVMNAVSYGFEETERGCCGVGRNNGQMTCMPLQVPCGRRRNYLFWDAFHPTEVANEIYAMKAYNSTSLSDVYPINIRQLALA
ncbi:GDSL esterase/lipase [Apostasia shenzhenica]|uniref:GDSL esterase/lipase n=1 Tax=Apostasia shenzhenica TaxID=1088818 RepID=A0A2I0ANQ2_9ASPA|nr:GDSL esterase/lipase [Apostasia shenzhenica]